MLKANHSRRKNLKNIPPRKNRQPQNGSYLIWLILGFMGLMLLASVPETSMKPQSEMTYTQFYQLVKDNPSTHLIKEMTLRESSEERIIEGVYSDGKIFRLQIPQNDEELLTLIRNNVPGFSVKPSNTFWGRLMLQLIPVLFIIGFIWFISYRGSQMGSRVLSFGKSRAQVSGKNKGRVTFNDVAGVDEAKEELQEVIEFLKEPKKFQRLGGKIPRGVLLVGPPGTGKTLLARAVAGEAEVPFFSLSGSDFVEMFVGVGASRVRDLFEQARKASQLSGKGAIVFIDEIDAVGRQRFSGIGGGNDEREQTLNALLVEMDGFNPQSGVFVVAATNRPDTLDPALLRPGRFDRQIVVTLPDIIGREQILKVHTRNLKVANNVNLQKLAQQTVYFSGADLANACNEAALLAARKNKDSIEMDDFFHAIERVTMGPEKKSRQISKKEKEQTAYHEAGHALISLLLDEVDTFTKVSIIPRGMAGGYTLTPPKEDRHYLSKKDLKGRMVLLLGGLVAEELYMKDTTTGVSNDLENVTRIARSMVCEFGMNENIGRMALGQNHRHVFLGRDLMDHQKDYSEDTAKRIDEEVRALVDEAYSRARTLLTENRDKLDKIAQFLIEHEIIDIDQAHSLLGLPAAKSDPAQEQGSKTEETSPQPDASH